MPNLNKAISNRYETTADLTDKEKEFARKIVKWTMHYVEGMSVMATFHYECEDADERGIPLHLIPFIEKDLLGVL